MNKSKSESNESKKSFYSINDFVSDIKRKLIKYSGYDINIEHHKGNVFISLQMVKNVLGLIIIKMVF